MSSATIFIVNFSWAVGNLTYPDTRNQTIFGEYSVINLLLLHTIEGKNNRMIVQEAMRALRNTCYSHLQNLEILSNWQNDNGDEFVSIILSVHQVPLQEEENGLARIT